MTQLLPPNADSCTIWNMNTRDGVTIHAPVERVWDVYTNVEEWPSWTASVTEVRLLDGAAGLAVGTRAHIKQPRFPGLVWTVTAIEPGASWTWVTHSRGATTTASHELEAIDAETTRVEQRIEQTGILGAVVGGLTRRLTRRYLAMEAAGLKELAEGRVPTS